MTEGTGLWDRVHVALDRRRDPLADRRLREELLERPEALAEILALREALNALREGRSSPRRRRIAMAFAAAIGLGAFAGLALRDTASSSAESAAASDSPAETAPLRESTRPRSRILELSMQAVVRRPDETLAATSDGRSIVRRSTLDLRPAAADDSSDPIRATLVAATITRGIQP